MTSENPMSTSTRSGSPNPKGDESGSVYRKSSAGGGGSAPSKDRRSGSGTADRTTRGKDPRADATQRRKSAAAKAKTGKSAGTRPSGDNAARRKPVRGKTVAAKDLGSAGRAPVARRLASPARWFRRPGRGAEARNGGVAPFVPPRNRLSRQLRLREWSRRGFVQLSPGKQKLRHRILPRTVIGIAFMLLSAGVGAAFSGAAFYAYYDDRLAENERTVARFVEGFDQQFTDASGALDELRSEAVGTIRSELAPLDDYVSNARGVVNLPASAGPSVWLVETRDEQGRIRNGSAFAIIGHRGGTALVTSYSVVLASTTSPGPGIDLLKGNERVPAELWAWDASRDLALLVVDRQIPILTMAGSSAQVQSVGGPVFALSGFGGQGATASPGVLIDHSQVGLQHTAPVGTLFAGGPLLDGKGRVVGMASTAYSPLGIDPGDVRQAPDVDAICAKILRCSENDDELSVETPGG